MHNYMSEVFKSDLFLEIHTEGVNFCFKYSILCPNAMIWFLAILGVPFYKQ